MKRRAIDSRVGRRRGEGLVINVPPPAMLRQAI
jgi:hypothetical protein